jgi:hypothetical protein
MGLALPAHSGPRVPAATRPSLRPLGLREGEEMKQSSGKTCRENAKLCLKFESVYRAV